VCKKKKLNASLLANYSPKEKLLLKANPKLIGTRHIMSKMIQETQGTIEGRCFI
jgi:hypothetical protein